MPRGIPNPKPDPKAKAIADLTALAADESKPLGVREAAAKALVEALMPKPKPEPAPVPEYRDPPLTSEQIAERAAAQKAADDKLKAELTAELLDAAAKGDERRAGRIFSMFQSHGWSNEIPEHTMAPRPGLTLDEQVAAAEKELQDTRETFQKNSAQAARGAALTARRTPFAQGGGGGGGGYNSDPEW